MADELSSALEDYLEAILELSADGSRARVTDIASRVGVHKSTVTAALHSLSSKGLVSYSPYESICLTPAGAELAAEISSRHRVLSRFLCDVLGLDSATADESACRLEHAIDRPCLERLLRFVEFMGSSSAGASCAAAFEAYCASGVSASTGSSVEAPKA